MRFTTTMPPRQVEAYLREQIRKIFGDTIENQSDVTASHGYYHVFVKFDKTWHIYFNNFRKRDVPKIVKALQGMV